MNQRPALLDLRPHVLTSVLAGPFGREFD